MSYCCGYLKVFSACKFIFFYHLPQRMEWEGESRGRVEVEEQAKAKAKGLMNPQAAQELYGSHATRSHGFRFWTA